MREFFVVLLVLAVGVIAAPYYDPPDQVGLVEYQDLSEAVYYNSLGSAVFYTCQSMGGVTPTGMTCDTLAANFVLAARARGLYEIEIQAERDRREADASGERSHQVRQLQPQLVAK